MNETLLLMQMLKNGEFGGSVANDDFVNGVTLRKAQLLKGNKIIPVYDYKFFKNNNDETEDYLSILVDEHALPYFVNYMTENYQNNTYRVYVTIPSGYSFNSGDYVKIDLLDANKNVINNYENTGEFFQVRMDSEYSLSGWELSFIIPQEELDNTMAIEFSYYKTEER